MEDDLDATVIKNTQLSLGKYVKRPPLSDKLLRKPPFRFLHDIVTSVLKSKGFFDGLFEENELISENVKDRESKISFLNKVIAVVSLTTGKTLTVKPTKIVAGQEPAKTNELLQCLAQALDDNLSSDEAVKQFKLGAKIPATNEKKNKEPVKVSKKNVESKKLTSKSSEKLVASDRSMVASEKDGYKSKTKDVLLRKKESPPKKSSSKTSNKKQSEKPNQEGNKNIVSEQKNVLANQKTLDNFRKHSQPEPALNEGTDTLDKESISIEQDVTLQNDSSNLVMNHSEKQLVLDDNESSLKPTSAHKSFRPNEENNEFKISKEENIVSSHSLNSDITETELGNDAIKIQSNHQSRTEGIKEHSTHNSNTTNSEVYHAESEESNRSITTNKFDKKDLHISSIIRPSSVRPSSSRPGAPRVRDKIDNVVNDAENIIVGKVNIISENTVHEEEEDTSIIIETNSTEELQTVQNLGNNHLVNQNSHLVQQILDSQREYYQTSGKTEIEWQFGTQKAPDIFIQEMEQLKFNVQALSRIANPLGKLLDHIQEDVEVMRQELQQWTQLYEETSKELSLQKNATNEALLPFRAKIKQLTSDMEERHDKITDLKISIHKNNSRIEKLLINSNVQ